MSRLIEADKILQKTWKVETKDMFHMTEIVDVVSAKDIKEAPTVKAIPIERLKKFANERALNDGMDGYWHFWGTDLLQMIEQWEKENGID